MPLKRLVAVLIALAVACFASPSTEAMHSAPAFHWGHTAYPMHIVIWNHASDTSYDAPLAAAVQRWNDDVGDLFTLELRDGSDGSYVPTGVNEPCGGDGGSINSGSPTGPQDPAFLTALPEIHVCTPFIENGPVSASGYPQHDHTSYSIIFNTEHTGFTAIRKQREACHEIGHSLGLSHPSDFSVPPTSCIDLRSNEAQPYPDQHDIDQLHVLYDHVDSTTECEEDAIPTINQFNPKCAGTDDDIDADGVTDTSDNCPENFNPSQANYASVNWTDTEADQCDLDDDNDSRGKVSGVLQEITRTKPFVYGGNANQKRCHTNGYTSARWDDCIERWVLTQPQADDCPLTTTADDEGIGSGSTLDRWVTDINDDGRTALADVLKFNAYFNQTVPPITSAEFGVYVRFDWNADGQITLADILLINPYFNMFCTDN